MRSLRNIHKERVWEVTQLEELMADSKTLNYEKPNTVILQLLAKVAKKWKDSKFIMLI